MTIKLAPVTGTYIGILGGYYLYLTYKVIKERQGSKISIGDGSSLLIKKMVAAGISGSSDEFAAIDCGRNEKLAISIRQHANFSEFVPIIGALAFINELHGAPSGLLHIILGSLTLARVAHVKGLDGANHAGLGRKIGAVSTFTSLGLLSIGSVYFSNKELIHSLIGR